MGGLSIWHWVVVLVVVVLVFGTKKLKNVGKDLGEGIQGFKDGLKGKDEPPAQLGSERRDAPPSETSSKVDSDRKDT